MTTTTIPKTIDAVMVWPVTGLPVKSRQEWTDRRFGSPFRLTTRVVGGRILLNQPAGQMTGRINALHLRFPGVFWECLL